MRLCLATWAANHPGAFIHDTALDDDWDTVTLRALLFLHHLLDQSEGVAAGGLGHAPPLPSAVRVASLLLALERAAMGVGRDFAGGEFDFPVGKTRKCLCLCGW